MSSGKFTTVTCPNGHILRVSVESKAAACPYCSDLVFIIQAEARIRELGVRS